MSELDYARIGRLLENWFKHHRRDLPWRENRSGYSALISEAMLQQTQVARVLERFELFMQRFPDVETLAAADEQAVLAMWSGLGYYRRARHLHQAAKMIVSEYGGEVPKKVSSLRKLPGVGRYTAGAISSIVYNQPAPIVDGNVQRVFARLDAQDGSGSEHEMREWAWDQAESLVATTKNTGTVNEALMELGATVCLPKEPRCDNCPLKRDCEAYRRGLTKEIPKPKQAAARKTLHHHAVVVQRAGAVLLTKRPENGLWASMWQPPTIEADTELPTKEILSRLPFRVTQLTLQSSFRHETTHRRVTFHVYTGKTRIRKGRWLTLNDLDEVPVGNPQRAILTGAYRKK